VLGAAQGGEIGVGGLAEGDVTGGRGDAEDSSQPLAWASSGRTPATRLTTM
jgi:hypothetical protein